MNMTLKIYESLLKAKNIESERGLADVLYFDFQKVLHALIDVQSVNTEKILSDFFLDSAYAIPPILADISDHKLSHVGFEIYEPLDLVMENLPNWLAELSLILKKTVTLKRKLRFSASAAFQQRVNAKVEILCLWLQVDERLLMLELFDIARSILNVLPPSCEDQEQKLNEHRWAMNYLFQNDSIWHYSISVGKEEVVQQLHDEFKSLVSKQPNYKLAYPAPIQNKYDRSFHTKLINLTHHIELEFVTTYQ